MNFTSAELLDFCTPDCSLHAVSGISEAYDFCKIVTLSHYENFPVASVLIPSNKRKHIFAVYAFSRIADDIADQLIHLPPEQRIDALNKYDSLLDNPIAGNPVFIALRNTIDELKIPLEPFHKLITAFKLDSDFKQAVSMEDLLFYCDHSANPVGELVLRIFGIYNETTSPLSDKICTALQLTNFWQDFSLDIPNGRFYIPTFLLDKYNLNKESLFLVENSVKLEFLLIELFDYTFKLFKEGKLLAKYLKPFRLKLEIKVTVAGGEAILRKTRALGVNAIKQRPRLYKSDLLTIFLKSIFLG